MLEKCLATESECPHVHFAEEIKILLAAHIDNIRCEYLHLNGGGWQLVLRRLKVIVFVFVDLLLLFERYAEDAHAVLAVVDLLKDVLRVHLDPYFKVLHGLSERFTDIFSDVAQKVRFIIEIDHCTLLLITTSLFDQAVLTLNVRLAPV